MFKLPQKSKYPKDRLYVLVEHTLIIYVQFMIGFKRKTLTTLREIVRERF